MAFQTKNLIPDRWIGVDLNTTGHIAVVADPVSGKVLKLGKKAPHIHEKYANLRDKCRSEKKFRKLKRLRSRERGILKDLNHKISREIVNAARFFECGIKLERIYGSRHPFKQKRTATLEFSIENGSFYQLQKMVEGKAKKAGVPVVYVDPSFTSKLCSRCGEPGIRRRKRFECPHCGHVDHADVNAAFNIASASFCVDRLHVDRDACNGSTDTPKRRLRERRSPQILPPMQAGDMSGPFPAGNVLGMFE